MCSVAENSIAELTPLTHCHSLRELNIAKNRVTSLLPLANCGQLLVLHAGHNLLSSLRGSRAAWSKQVPKHVQNILCLKNSLERFRAFKRCIDARAFL